MTKNIPTVIVEFHDLPDFWWTLKQWKEFGGYRAFLKDCCMSIAWIKKVNYCLKDAKEYPTDAWEG